MSIFHPSFEMLPEKIAIFPLPGVLLLPGQVLPLNIFEERYLNMVEDAMGQGHMIGMIQPRQPEDTETRTQIVSADSELYDVGCMGRITHFEETQDGRFGIQLRGVCRFRLVGEAVSKDGYREGFVEWDGFQHDLDPIPNLDLDRKKLIDLVGRFFHEKQINIELQLLEKTELEILIDALCMICPFGPAERQALLESEGLASRAEMFMALLEMALLQKDEGGSPSRSN